MAFRFMSQNINIKFKIRILTPATPGDQFLFEIYKCIMGLKVLHIEKLLNE